MIPLKQILLICALVGCGKKEAESPTVEIADPILEQVIRAKFNKPRNMELTERELEYMTSLSFDDKKLTEVPKGLEKLTQLEVLYLGYNQLADVKGSEKLTPLTRLYLNDNPDLTKAQIHELQKALPNCEISFDGRVINPTK